MLRNKDKHIARKNKESYKTKETLDVETLEHKALNILAEIALIELLKKYHLGRVIKSNV